MQTYFFNEYWHKVDEIDWLRSFEINSLEVNGRQHQLPALLIAVRKISVTLPMQSTPSRSWLFAVVMIPTSVSLRRHVSLCKWAVSNGKKSMFRQSLQSTTVILVLTHNRLLLTTRAGHKLPIISYTNYSWRSPQENTRLISSAWCGSKSLDVRRLFAFQTGGLGFKPQPGCFLS